MSTIFKSSTIFTKLNLTKILQYPISVLLVSGLCSTHKNNSRMACACSPMDPNSFSRPDLALVTNLFIALDINFDRRVLSGNTDLTVKKIDNKVEELILDVKDLDIQDIFETQSNEKLKFTVTNQGPYGSKLTIDLPKKELDTYIISVRYETSPSASGLQWLLPEQTAGKKDPFVFSQFQAIHARSVIPCQDTPSVKTKYSAVITAPKQMKVLMSAINDHSKPLLDRAAHHFEQKIPVPSYLIAIAAGALESREIGPRSKVWAEKSVVEQAAYEFGDTERQLQTAEAICGPYVWGTYDVLVLPPSFPFGGMENPCLTFVTPTLLAGDKSLANVVAHEIAHSWTGNLVTNANFEHFWLNEGFTMCIERKILGKLKDSQLQDFHAYGGFVELEETIKRLGPKDPLTKLVVNLKGVDPDDAFSSVPYEKGYIFLRYLENLVGGPDKFETFLRLYFQTFQYKSVKTDDFKKFFLDYFKDINTINEIDWETWLYAPGMPPVIPEYDHTLRKICENHTRQFVSWDGQGEFPISADDIKNMIPDQKIQLLQLILDEKPQPIDKLRVFENEFNLADVKNSEMKFRWFRICIKANWEDKIPPILQWLNQVGRMKYTRPLYRDLYQWEKARTEAIGNFEKNKRFMMHVSSYTIAKDLQVTK